MPRFRRCRFPNCHAMVALPDHYCKQHYEHEAEYLASRQKWARSRNKTYTHKYDHVTRNRDDVKREQYKFYRTKQWSHLRQLVLDRDHYLCRYCDGILTPAKTVDHIVPIEYDPSLKADPDNLAVICGSCHRLKTDWEQSYYGTGSNNELNDVSPIKSIGRIKRLMNES